MIDRYCTKEMTMICSEYSKFSRWLDVELAVIHAKIEMGLIPKEAGEIKSMADFCTDRLFQLNRDIEAFLQLAVRNKRISPEFESLLMAKISDFILTGRIREIEKDTHHDLISFVHAVQESLPDDLRKHFHQDITSYDIEEPALALMILQALKLVFRELNELSALIREKALNYKKLVRMERSHGQHAEPNTLGIVFLGWYDSLERQKPFLRASLEEMSYSKISGAVGTYTGNLSLELEKRALGLLGLKPATFSSQIILRDRHAHLMDALSVLAGVIENIALNIRLLGQTEIREVQEPFGKNQMGSSRMPHKKNPVLTENLCGLARVVRYYAGIAKGSIPSWGGRDISHSSTERITLPDAFQLVHFMLKRLKKVIGGLVVNEENIERNMELSKFTFFSPEVKKALVEKGVDPKKAYEIAQRIAFMTMKEDKGDYCERLITDAEVIEHLTLKEITDIFDIDKKLKHIDEIYQRFGL